MNSDFAPVDPPKKLLQGTVECIRKCLETEGEVPAGKFAKRLMPIVSKGVTDHFSKHGSRGLTVARLRILLGELADTIQKNWESSGAARGGARNADPNNWRWGLCASYPKASPEKIERREHRCETKFERELAQMLESRPTERSWASQIPTCRGIPTSRDGSGQNIDLAQWDKATKRVTLIEIKVRRSAGKSDSPLSAAFQVVCYAFLLRLARVSNGGIRMAKMKDANSTPWEEAHEVSLRVIAPACFYAPHQLYWFEEQLDAALRSFECGADLKFTGFAFRAFPDSDGWHPQSERELLDLLDPLIATGVPPWGARKLASDAATA